MLKFNLGFNARYALMADGSMVMIDVLMVRVTVSYFFNSLWFDLSEARTLDLLHSRQAC
jgi:hypothetical protein